MTLKKIGERGGETLEKMSSMAGERADEETLETLKRFAGAHDEIFAVFLTGSRANPDVSVVDEFSDFDVIFGVSDPLAHEVLNAALMRLFGPLVILQVPDDSEAARSGGRMTYLMQFETLRVDATYALRERLGEEIAGERFTTVLWSREPEARFSELLPAWKPEPFSQTAFSACTNEFWWVFPYAGKGLARGQLLYAAGHVENVLRPELLRLLGWELAGAESTLVPAKCFHNFEAAFGKAEYRNLLQTFRLDGEESIREALGSLAEMFSFHARRTASLFGAHYDAGEEARVREFCRTKFGL